MDKFFLLTYTCIDYDGLRRLHHAWFATEEDMKSFIKEYKEKDAAFEMDLAIEILSHREILLNE